MCTTRLFPKKTEKEMSSPTAWHQRHMKDSKTTSLSSPTSTATEPSSMQNWYMSSSSLYFGLSRHYRKKKAMAQVAPIATATYVKGVKRRPMLLKHITYPAQESAKLKFLKVARTDVAHIVRKWPNPDFIRQLQEFLINFAIAPTKPGDHGIS